MRGRSQGEPPAKFPWKSDSDTRSMNQVQGKLPSGIFKLAVLNTLCFISFAIIAPVLDRLIRERFGVDNEGTAKFMAVHGAATLIFGLVAGVWSDKLGRRAPLIVAGLIGSGLFTAAIPHVDDFGALLVLRFFDGAFGAFALGLLLTRALDLAGSAHRNRAMGVMSIAIAAGFLIAPVLTGTIGVKSLELLFALVGGALIAGGLWMAAELGVNERIVPMGRGLRSIVGALTGNPKLAIPLGFAFVDKFTFGTLAHLTSLAVKDLHGRGTLASSVVLFAFWIAFALMCVPGGRLCDRRGALSILVMGSAAYGAALALLGLLGFPGFVAVMALAGGFCAVQYVPCVALVGEFSPADQRGLSMGAWNMAGSLGMVVGLVASGKLSTIGYGLAYGVAGGLEIACAALGFLYLILSKRRAEGEPVPASEVARGSSDAGPLQNPS